MNVASKELCKELYELSGWGQTSAYYKQRGDGITINYITRQPAYDLGYLLRKLPQYVVIRKNANRPKGNSIGNWKGGYTVFLDHNGGMSGIKYYAKTPEDAACKLAIELFKQGILK